MLTQQAQAAAGLPQNGGAVSAAERAIRAVQRPQQAGQLPQELFLCVRACGRKKPLREEAAGSAAPPAVHPALHAPCPAPSTAVPSSRRSRAPRAVSSAASRAHSALKSAHAGPRDAPSGSAPYLRRGARQCESLCVCVPRRVRPSRTQGYTTESFTPVSAGHPLLWPHPWPLRLRTRCARPLPPGTGSAPPLLPPPPLSNHILVRRRFGAIWLRSAFRTPFV